MEGRFEFTREAISCERVIKKGRMEIILDGLRLLDEGKIPAIDPSLPPAPEGVHPAEAVQRSSEQPPTIRGPIVDYTYVVDEESFYDGEEIVREGSHGNWIWVILEGAAEILKAATSGPPLRLLRVSDGAFIGSLVALLRGDHVRSTTVIASGNIQLGMLDSQVLSNEVASLSPDFKTLIQSMENRLRHLTGLAVKVDRRDASLLQSLQNKKIAIEQGQNEERLFCIRAGEVVIARQSPVGCVPLACLQKGDLFGHLPFLTIGHEPYEAAVFSSPDTKLAAVDSGKLENEHRRLSPTLRNIIEHLAACISATTLVTINRIANSGLF
jgi:CRP-like cAMP-binding protein